MSPLEPSPPMSLIMHACVICNCTCTCSCICMLHHRRPHLASYAHDLCAKSFAFHCAAFHSGLCYSILVLRIGGLWDLSRQFIFLQLSRKIFGRGSFEQDMFFHRRNETNLFRRSVPFYRTTRKFMQHTRLLMRMWARINAGRG